MEIFSEANWTRFTKLIPEMRKSIDDWKIVSVMLGKDEAKGPAAVQAVAEALLDSMRQCEGAIFIISDYEVAAFAYVGKAMTLDNLKTWVSRGLSPYKCDVSYKNATIEGVKKIEIIVSSGAAKKTRTAYERMRDGRRDKVIMVVDDDMFIRSLLAKAASPFGTVTELNNGTDVLDAYRSLAPDAIFLDIHLPGKTGTDVLKEVTALDPSAFIVMVSADSARDQVLEAQRCGARWFLSKPVTAQKVEEALKKSPVFAQKTLG